MVEEEIINGTKTGHSQEKTEILKDKIIYTYGAFDILHIGHIILLKRAKELGSYLIVGIVGDDAIKKLKGNDRPLNDAENRMRIISELKCVDEVCYQESYNPDLILLKLREKFPDSDITLVKGDDWDYIPGQETIEKIGGKLVKLPYSKKWSSSKIIKKMRSKI